MPDLFIIASILGFFAISFGLIAIFDSLSRN